MTGSWWSSTEAVAVPAGRVARGRLRPPGSKSATNRACALALLAGEPLELVDPLEAEDVERFLAVLARMGVGVERAPGRLRLVPAPAGAVRAEGAVRLDCGESGTLLRFLVALAAVVPGAWEIDGAPRLRERPIGPLVAALRGLGVRIGSLGAEGFAPVRVEGGRLGGGRVRLDAGESSQPLSALLLAGQGAAGPIEIEAPRLVSAPYVDLTIDAIEARGGRVERPRPGCWIARPSRIRGGVIEIEPDLSAAVYPAAAAALTGGDVVLEGVSLGSRQGDRRFLELLSAMGARVEAVAGGTRVRGGALAALEADLGDLPDPAPTLAALAPFARGTTRIRGVAHLRLKESDRLAAMAAELRRIGAEVEELADGLVVPGVWAEREPPADPVTVDPHGDHRIAMSMAVAGLRRPGVSIARPGVVAKSWPGFWTELGRLLEPAAEAEAS